MKIDTSYDWSFKVLNEAATRNKHAKTIQRMKASGLRFEDIIDRYFEDQALQDSIYPQGQRGSMWFSYFFVPHVKEKGKLTKPLLRELKTRVNGVVYESIMKNLEYNGYPKSWATAFYMAYYSKINNIMTRITKEIVRNYL